MHFSDPSDIEQFVVESIGVDYLGEYKVWNDFDSFCIVTDSFRLTVGHSASYQFPLEEQILSITSLTLRKGTFYLSLSRETLALFQISPKYQRGDAAVYKDRFKTRINEWFFNGAEAMLEHLFNS